MLASVAKEVTIGPFAKVIMPLHRQRYRDAKMKYDSYRLSIKPQVLTAQTALRRAKQLEAEEQQAVAATQTAAPVAAWPLQQDLQQQLQQQRLPILLLLQSQR